MNTGTGQLASRIRIRKHETIEDELNSILDRILPLRQYDRRARPSDPWFDKECRDAKRLMGLLQLRYEHDSSTIRLRFERDTTSYEELCAFEQ